MPIGFTIKSFSNSAMSASVASADETSCASFLPRQARRADLPFLGGMRIPQVPNESSFVAAGPHF
jgi:hypothetical protein